MKSSNIGGQAVMEGIMMRHDKIYSVAVRKPDERIEVKVEPYKPVINVPVLMKIPIIRGFLSFLDSLVIGIRTLMYSATFFEDEEDLKKREDEKASMTPEQLAEAERKEKKEENMLMAGTLLFSLVIAVAVFMVLPYFVTNFLRKVTEQEWIIALSESIMRVLIFLVYLIIISRMKDIQRTFMYHGAEHKCINCVEHGLELNVENVLKSSRLHKRCGTSFLFFVVIVSAVVLMFVHAESHVMRIVIRLCLIPVIAGISYEIIRLAGRSDSAFVNLLSKPGLALQKLTTREPDASQAEVAIAAVEAVFDWREYLRENFGISPEEKGTRSEAGDSEAHV